MSEKAHARPVNDDNGESGEVKIEKWSFWEVNEENEQKWKWRQRRRLQLGHQRTGEPLCYSGQSLSLSSTLSSKWVFETRHPLHHHYHHHHQVFRKCRLINFRN